METKKLINLLGGTAKTAELCQVTQGAVSQWIHHGIPDARLMFLKLARPDIFTALESHADKHLPYDIPNGGLKRETKASVGRQPVDPKKDLT